MAYKPSISEIVDATVKLPAKERAAYLRKHDSDALRAVLQYAVDPRAAPGGENEWLLPKGEIPYTQNTNDALYTVLYHESKKLYLFVKGGNPDLSPKKRLILFIDFLEKLNAADAELMMKVKDQALPEEISASLVNEAFPGLIQEVEKRGRGRPRKDAAVKKESNDGQVEVQ